jgi:glycosyltransferase involved in cell wall biosynthesis
VLHANSTSATRAVLLAALRTRRPVVWHLRNSALSSRERVLLRTASLLPRSRVVAVSRVAAAVAGLERKAHVISDAVMAPTLRQPPPIPPVRVGVVTNGMPAKGLDILVEVAGLVRDRDVVFDVYGLQGFPSGRTPHLRACYRRARELGVLHMIEDRGLVASLAEAYGDMHIALSVTRRESFGRVAVEAMRAGVPVLIPSDPGLMEATDRGRHATVYRLGDPHDAASKLEEMSADLAAISRSTEVAARWAQRYDPRTVAREMIDVYQSIVS